MSRVVLDQESLLVDVAGEVPLDELEAALAGAGCTLALDAAPDRTTVAAWLAGGARGARSPWHDPADHLLAGFEAESVATREALVVRAAPRKSVGPDLSALVLGMEGRFFAVTRATLRVFTKGEREVVVPFSAPPDAPPSDGERTLLDRLEAELARTDAPT